MKAIIKRPYQRQLLVVLSLTVLTGCSGFQPNANAVYQNLEQRVQKVYKAAAPIHKEGLVPALFKSVSVPGMEMLKRPLLYRANFARSYTPKVQVPKPTKTEVKESQYIEQHYGL